MALIRGTSRGETLRGTEWADSIDGHGGNDKIIGGEENDALRGGDGRDLFAFMVDESTDTILDFHKGDQLELQGISFKDLDTNGSGAVNGKDVAINFTNGSLVILLEEAQFPVEEYGKSTGDGLVLQGVTSLSSAAFLDGDYFF